MEQEQISCLSTSMPFISDKSTCETSQTTCENLQRSFVHAYRTFLRSRAAGKMFHPHFLLRKSKYERLFRTGKMVFTTRNLFQRMRKYRHMNFEAFHTSFASQLMSYETLHTKDEMSHRLIVLCHMKDYNLQSSEINLRTTFTRFLIPYKKGGMSM